jgi:hypothetical protein
VASAREPDDDAGDFAHVRTDRTGPLRRSGFRHHGRAQSPSGATQTSSCQGAVAAAARRSGSDGPASFGGQRQHLMPIRAENPAPAARSNQT